MNEETKADKIVKQIGEMGNLPALDSNVGSLCRLAERKNTQIAELASIIMRDASLTANMLTLANSVTYAPRVPIQTVTAALIHLGVVKSRALALRLSVFKETSKALKDRELYRLFACSCYAGTIAMNIARSQKHKNPEEVFLAGVFCQLPRLMLANSYPEKYAEMEDLVNSEHMDLDAACIDVFGAPYSEITKSVAGKVNLPGNITQTIANSAKFTNDVDSQGVVELGTSIADMLFGNKAAGSAPMKKAEERLQELVNDDKISLSDYLGEACDDDNGFSELFHMSKQDVSMMVKIAEWGKVSSADVAANLAQGEGFASKFKELAEDPRMLIGEFLTQLATCGRGAEQTKNALLIGQEAIWRCLKPACVFTAFIDLEQNVLIGRMCLANHDKLEAKDYIVPLSDEKSPSVQSYMTLQPIHFAMRDGKETIRRGRLRELNLKHVACNPIAFAGKAVGLYFVGRSEDAPFSSEELVWLQAIATNVGLAFS